jgi:hypothetical protein
MLICLNKNKQNGSHNTPIRELGRDQFNPLQVLRPRIQIKYTSLFGLVMLPQLFNDLPSWPSNVYSHNLSSQCFVAIFQLIDFGCSYLKIEKLPIRRFVSPCHKSLSPFVLWKTLCVRFLLQYLVDASLSHTSLTDHNLIFPDLASVPIPASPLLMPPSSDLYEVMRSLSLLSGPPPNTSTCSLLVATTQPW